MGSHTAVVCLPPAVFLRTTDLRPSRWEATRIWVVFIWETELEAAAAQGEGRHMWRQALPVEYAENIIATDYV